MLIIFSVILFSILSIVAVLFYWSPGKIKPMVDSSGKVMVGSISEKSFVEINGSRQGMFIKGVDSTKQVLLFIHGGPAMPEYAISRKYKTILENHFIVCWWDQRGAGLSYSKGIAADKMTAAQIIDDTREVTNYLRGRFKQDKIYLLGHSWGSYIGIKAAAATPELYHAYIAVSQLTNQMESEKEAYSYMLDNYRKSGNKKMVKRLEEIHLLQMHTMPSEYRSLRDAMMHEQGIGTTREMRSVISGIFIPVMQDREYTLMEKINLWKGKWSEHSTTMWNKMLEEDVSLTIKTLDIPVYFIHGIHDYTVSYNLARRYYETLSAPVKIFYTFEQSAHSPIFEEPEKLDEVLLEILDKNLSYSEIVN